MILTLQNINFMDDYLSSNNVENDELNLHPEDSDYKDLINRLKEIQITISLLEKTIFK